MDTGTTEKRKQHPKDPRFLLVYGIGDLERVLPWERKTIKDLEAMDLFPRGVSIREGMQKVWTRKALEAYLEIVGEQALAQIPQIAETIRAVMKARVA